MIDLAVISGTGFYDFPGLQETEVKRIKTRYGNAVVCTGMVHSRRIAFIARHGKNHQILPNMINYRANLIALKELGAKVIIGTTVCGVLDPDIPLARLAVFCDLYFPDNRLPGGEASSIYDEQGDKQRGHYIFGSPYSEHLRRQLISRADNPITDAVYAHVNGPRFNSRAEISMLKNHASFISQTSGPEVVLAGELEIPCALIGFGVDYANGVKEEPTPVEVLNQNITASKAVFSSVISSVIQHFEEPAFEGFIYRFD